MGDLEFIETIGNRGLQARLFELGDDLLVIVTGGAAHIGAVAMATPRASLADPRLQSATSSVYTYIGHKEDLLVKLMSEEIAAKLGRKVVVLAGIHWDDMLKEEVRGIVDACKRLSSRIVEETRKS
jgi:gallate decarboxylase subunit D